MQSAQYYMSAVQHDYRASLSSASSVQKPVIVPRVVDKPPARQRIRKNYPYHSVAIDDISETHTDKFYLRRQTEDAVIGHIIAINRHSILYLFFL
jgi:hypothetical protein